MFWFWFWLRLDVLVPGVNGPLLAAVVSVPPLVRAVASICVFVPLCATVPVRRVRVGLGQVRRLPLAAAGAGVAGVVGVPAAA